MQYTSLAKANTNGRGAGRPKCLWLSFLCKTNITFLRFSASSAAFGWIAHPKIKAGKWDHGRRIQLILLVVKLVRSVRWNGLCCWYNDSLRSHFDLLAIRSGLLKLCFNWVFFQIVSTKFGSTFLFYLTLPTLECTIYCREEIFYLSMSQYNIQMRRYTQSLKNSSPETERQQHFQPLVRPLQSFILRNGKRTQHSCLRLIHETL